MLTDGSFADVRRPVLVCVVVQSTVVTLQTPLHLTTRVLRPPPPARHGRVVPGYYSALNHHGLTEQVPRTVYVVTPTRAQSREIHGVPYRVTTVTERKFFGVEPTSIEGTTVQVSDLEKTLVDCADHPEFCGGLRELATAMRTAADRNCDWDTVGEYLERLGNGAATKRIAYLADQLGIDLLRFASGPTPDGLAIYELDADGTGSAPDTPADDPTGGEAVILEHTGSGELPIDGYEVAYDGRAETITSGGREPLSALAPGDHLVVYTGDGLRSDPGVRTVAFGLDVALIHDDGTVTVRTPTGEVSAFAER